jgi:iron(III) transport system ATP-binding protein
MAAISIRGLRKAYGESVALDGLDLDIADGEVVALLGPSGCGKTTTLQLLAGFLTPDAGEIKVGDRVLSTAGGVVPPERRNMSLIFQSYAIWPHRTVAENVGFGLEVRKVKTAERRERIAKVLETVRMAKLADRYPAELSGGQQQRVALARALVVEPEILLLDEPLSNLDANLREEMRFEIRRLHDQTGITMVYVTHDQSEAMVTADRIVVMNHGRSEQVGTPEDVYERPSTRFVASFIGRTNSLQGILVERGLVDFGGARLRAADDSGLAAGAPAVVCVRPQHIRLGAAGPEPDVNEIRGRVVRGVYTGEARDYIVELAPSGQQIRVLAQPTDQHEVNTEVNVCMPAQLCRVLAP